MEMFFLGGLGFGMFWTQFDDRAIFPGLMRIFANDNLLKFFRGRNPCFFCLFPSSPGDILFCFAVMVGMMLSVEAKLQAVYL